MMLPGASPSEDVENERIAELVNEADARGLIDRQHYGEVPVDREKLRGRVVFLAPARRRVR